MSEVVDRRMEAMTEELDEMKRLKLIDIEKMRRIIKNRKDFEYKINGLSKHLNDYKEYIKYEETILSYIKLSRNKLRINEKMANIENRIIKRIKNLYETGIQRFPQDLLFCLSYFRFSKKCNHTTGATSAIHFLTNNHSKNPEVWCIAAKYYLFDKKDSKTARTMLHKGISLNKDSTELYTEIVQFEVLQVMGSDTPPKLEETAELKEKQEVCLKTLRAFLKTIYKNITNCSFYCDLLSFLVNYKFTNELQNEIIQELLEHHSNKPELWDYLAQRDYNYDGENSTSQRMRSTLCFEKYKEGLRKVPETAKQELWNKCIDFLIKINLDDFVSGNVSKTKSLLEAYQQANDEGYLSEEYYVSWIDKVKENEEKYAIAEKGTEKYPKSTDLWRQRFYLKQDLVFDTPIADSEMNQLFRLGVEALKEDSLILWNGILRYHLINSNTEVVEEIYKEGIKQPGTVGNDLKPRYITWLNLTKGINAARKAYAMMADVKPYCKELHEAMWRAESTEIKFDFDSWVEVHKLAVKQFGTEDVDVWIDYLRFHMLYNQSNDLTKETIENVVDKALKLLPEHLHLEFQDKYGQLENLAK